MPIKDFFLDRLKSIGIALRGMILLIKHEANIQTQLWIGLLVTIAGFIFDISPNEWLFQIFSIGLGHEFRRSEYCS
jgi:diacylglycerol kinase